jgi:hypothetical protein
MQTGGESSESAQHPTESVVACSLLLFRKPCPPLLFPSAVRPP